MMEKSKPTYCSAIGRCWLICVETNQNDGRFQVVTVQAFLEWMICLRKAEPEGKPKLILLLYNFQGFNGYFVLNQLYRKDMSPQQIVNRAMKTPVFGIDPAQNQIHRQLEPFPMPLADFLKAFSLQEEAKDFFPPFSTDPNTKRMWALCPTSIITTQTAGAKNVASPLAGGMTVITLKHPAPSSRFNFASKDKLTKKKDQILIKDLISYIWKNRTKKQGWFYNREYIFHLPIFRKARPSFFRVLCKNLKKEDSAFRNM